MWTLLIQVGIMGALWGLNKLLAPPAAQPKPLTANNLTTPRNTEGVPIPILVGRCRMTSPIIAYQGSFENMIVDNANNTAAWNTFGMNMLFIAGLPMGNGVTKSGQLTVGTSRLWNVWFGDQLLPPPIAGSLPGVGVDAYVSQMVYQPDLFGGAGAGGGLMGAYQFFGGYTDQDFAGSAIGADMAQAGRNGGFGGANLLYPNGPPGMRRMMCVAFTDLNTGDPTQGTDGTNGGGTHAFVARPPGRWYWGESSLVNSVSFEISSYGDLIFSMVTPGVDFAGDADPVEVIYDLLTNAFGRGGLSTSKIDMVSFLAASTTLNAENHGYSNVIYESTTCADAISAILAQIDATLYEEPTTGLLKIKLIRNDYTIGSIPVFDATNIVDADPVNFGTFVNTINEVRVQFTDRWADYNTATAVAQSQANAVGNNNRRRTKVSNYPGITNGVLAGQVAARDLNSLSQPLIQATITVNRDGYTLRPGDVILVNYPAKKLNGIVFRVQRPDFGQLASNKIVLNCTQDAFASTYQGSGRSFYNQIPLVPSPIAARYLTEAPAWLTGDAQRAGLITDPGVAHLLPLPLASTNASAYAVKTRQNLITARNGNTLFYNWYVDVPNQPFPTTFTLSGGYAIELAPYDATTGFTINNVVGATTSTWLDGSVTSFGDIANHADNLICVIAANGIDHEFMAYTTGTPLGGGSFKLTNVWRGLFDTPPMKFVGGERGFFVQSGMMSRRGWSVVKPIAIITVPKATFTTGSGEEPEDFYTPINRSALPLPPANVSVGGAAITGGVLGTPSNAGRYHSATFLEEGIDLYGYIRQLTRSTITRGDAGNDGQFGVANTYQPRAFYTGAVLARGDGSIIAAYNGGLKVGGNQDLAIRSPSTISGFPVATGLVSADAQALVGVGWQVDGFGAIDLCIDSSFSATDLIANTGGIQAGDQLYSWQKARVPVVMPSWRNLIVNPRLDYTTALGNALPAWADTSGVMDVASSSFSLSQAASGPGSNYLQPDNNGTNTAVQAASISTWKGTALEAVAVAYIKNANSDTNDTGTVRIDACNVAATSIANASTTAIGLNANWTRTTVSLALPLGTLYYKMSLSSVEVTGTGSLLADTCFTEMELRIGQFATTQGLTNGSFESTMTSWTITAGGYTADAGGSASPHFANGTTGPINTAYQEYALPAGFEYGCTAFCTFFAGSGLVNDQSIVEIDAMHGSSTILASDVVTNSYTQLNVWFKGIAAVACPDGATKVRTTINATRTLGSGTSGVSFDELTLWVVKDIAPRTIKTYAFSTPTITPTPGSWQEFALSYPAIPVPNYFMGGNDFDGYGLAWTDTGAHPTAKMCGQFGAGVPSRNAYQFARASGAGATHVAAQGTQRAVIGYVSTATAFSAMVEYRIDALGAFASACGLFGRMSLSAGWGLSLNASGQPVALLRGAGATTATATGSNNTADGAWRRAWLVNDPIGKTVTVYDDRGNSSSASTASLGEIAESSTACHLRIGRDCDDHDVMPGQVGACAVWMTVALTSAQIASMTSYANDPNAAGATATRSATVIASGPTDTTGETAYYLGANQFPHTWSAQLTIDGGSGYGMPVSGVACVNLVQSADFTNATYWTTFGSTSTLTQGVVDATGLPRGVNVATTVAGDGLLGAGMPLAATPANTTLTFWARLNSGASLDVKLTDSAGVVKSTTNIVPDATWTKYQLALAGWTGSTATAHLEIVGHTGAVNFDLAHTTCLAQGSDIPEVIPLPGVTLAAHGATITTTLPVQFNSEGELIAAGVNTGVPTITTGSIVNVTNGANNDDRKELQQLPGTSGFCAVTYDGTATATGNASQTYTIVSGHIWEAHCRWNRASIPDSAGGFSNCAVTDSVALGAYTITTGRSTIWTMSTTPCTTIQIGIGTVAPSPMILRSVVVQTREEKLL